MKTILSVLALVFAAVLAPARAEAQAVPPIPVPVTIDGALDDFFLEEFDYVEGVIVAIGTVTITVTDPEGGTTEVTEVVAIPVTDIDASCESLTVVLAGAALEGGGTVDAGATLVVTPDDAPDTNLDNLLCSTGQLVGSNASGNAIAKKLNKILAIVSAATEPT